MELSDKAFSTFILLKRFSPLMNGLDNATDETIYEVCEEIIKTLEEWK